jgi:uncharacterized protein (DUF885 family)
MATMLRSLFAVCLITVASPLAAKPAVDPNAQADALFESYFEALLEQNPLLATSIGDNRYNDRFPVQISPENRAKAKALDERFLKEAKRLPAKKLDAARRLSLEVFISNRERSIEGYKFPGHLIPLNQFFSTPNSFAQLGSGSGTHPFKTVKDYEDFLKRMDGFVAWTDQAIVNMREGVKKGYTQPRILMERVLPQLESQMKDDPTQTTYWGAVKALPEGFSPEDKARLEAAYREAITTKIVPAYRKLHAFVKDEYIPKCRTTASFADLPDGDDWYAYNVRQITTTDLSPAEIHAIGLKEVARIQGEMRKLMAEIRFPAGEGDNLQAFFKFMKEDPQYFFEQREDLIKGYYEIKAKVDPNLPKLFETLPKADFEVRLVEPFRERSASGGQYNAASEDGSRPGVFYANAYDLKSRPKWAMESLLLHEGNPGHHFQITVARENKALPRFRRFGGYTAYSEGWGLYAESLGKDLGIYTDPAQRYGQLDAEIWRAIRLVVDTGYHSKGWTREQVLDYMRANSSRGEAAAVSEAERYMAIPGQALAYKIGELKFKELRARAEAALGLRFDIRRFHSVVLMDGALPLDVLETKVDRWIESQR